MYCQRCKSKLGHEEGQFIMLNGKEVCVCAKCHEEIRQLNIIKEGKHE